MRILIVEDDTLLANGIVSYLKQAGYAVDLALNGEQADSWLAHEQYDLAILDLGLPKLDGTEVLRKLRRRGQTLPVLILTALGRRHGSDTDRLTPLVILYRSNQINHEIPEHHLHRCR